MVVQLLGERDMFRYRIACALAVGTALACSSTAGAQSGADFPIYGEDQWLGSVNELTRPLFTQYFNQVTPENAGKWGSAAGHDAHRGHALGQPRHGLQLRPDQRLPVQLPRAGLGQPAADVDGRAARRGAAGRDQEVVRGASRSAIPNIEWLQVVNEPLHDPPDCTHSASTRATTATPAATTRARSAASNGTDGTGWDWILNAFRLAKQYFPNTKLMINDYSITNSDTATDAVPADHQPPQAREPDPHRRRAGPRVLDHRQHGAAQGEPGSARRHRACRSRSPSWTSTGSRPAACQATRCSCATTAGSFPTFWEHPGVEGITVWGWRQPNHWRNAQNAPIVLSNDTPKPAAHWLYNYVRGIAPVIRPDQSFAISDVNAGRSARSRPTIGPRRSAARTCGRSPGASPAATARALRHRPEHGRAPHRRSAAAGRAHDVHAEGARERRLTTRATRPTSRSSPGISRTWPTRRSAPPCRRRCRCRSARNARLRRVHARRGPGLRGQRRPPP